MAQAGGTGSGRGVVGVRCLSHLISAGHDRSTIIRGCGVVQTKRAPVGSGEIKARRISTGNGNFVHDNIAEHLLVDEGTRDELSFLRSKAHCSCS